MADPTRTHPDTSDDVRTLWDSVAADWHIQVGDEGDQNRILDSDPVLWTFAGDVAGRDVLDAGCGTGYLSRKLRDKGARVIGIDYSEQMIAIAQSHAPQMDYRVDSISDLRTLGDAQFDLVVSNYVLMDAPDLDGAARSIYRVLRPNGVAALVFSHPCFPQGDASKDTPEGRTYLWPHSYFEHTKRVDAPWRHFKSHFIWFHRPLSDYWKAFRGAGFMVEELEEPRITPDRYHLMREPQKLIPNLSRPFSIAFKLRKPA